MQLNRSASLLALLFVALSVGAQTRDSQSDASANDFSSSVTAARCRYTPADKACLTGNGEDTLAQFSRHGGPPMLPPRPVRYSRGYEPAWGPGNGRHAAIGALIGFGLGAAIGAKANTDPHPGATVKASLLVGIIGTGLGAAVGAGTPAFRALNLRRRRPFPGNQQDDDDQVASQSKPDKPEASE